MKSQISSLLLVVLPAPGMAAETPPPVPLRAAGGPVVALWQKTPNPRKPYVAQLVAPGPEPLALLEDSPADHAHHHALMFAIGVDDTDFWSEQGVPDIGNQTPVAPAAAPAGGIARQQVRWLAADGSHLLDEQRELRVRTSHDGGIHWLDWQSTLSPAAGRDTVRLWGGHYFGLGMRLQRAWAGKARFLWAETSGQQVVRGDEKLTPGAWCAVQARIDDHPATVLMIAHPDNPRPTRWFTMGNPFCYLSATLNLEDQPASLSSGECWTLRWGIAVTGVETPRDELARLAREWIQTQQQTPATTNQAKP